MMPFGVNSDPILRAQKQRNRVRGCVVGDAPILLPRLRRHLALGHWERGVHIMIFGYRGKKNKGVLDRPWTKWMVLRAISGTLKGQFTEKHENEKI